MIKVTVLLPTYYNNGMLISSMTIDELLDKMDDITGGHTRQGYCDGAYRMHDGRNYDRNIVVWVVCNSDKLSALREWAFLAAQRLQQESIYFEYQQTNVEFIRA